MRSILLSATLGVLAVSVWTVGLSTALNLDRLKDGARARIAHAAHIGAISTGAFLRNSTDVAWQVTSRSRARALLAQLNAGAIEPDVFRDETRRILSDALHRTAHLRGIARLDRGHRRVASVGEAIPDRILPGRGEVAGAALVTGPFELSGRLRILVAAPILDQQGYQIGTDLTLFSLEGLAQLLLAGAHDDAGQWDMSVFLRVAGEGAETYYAPISGAAASLRVAGTEELLGQGGELDILATAHERPLSLGDFVFAGRPVADSDWLVLARQSTADLYGGVYGDLAVSLSAALLLSACGALILLLVVRRYSQKLVEEVGGLRTDIEASEARYSDLFEGSIQGILIHRDFRPLLVNKAWADLHGLTTGEVMALKSIEPLISSDDLDRLMRFQTARLKGETVPECYDYQAVHKSGKLVWVENSARVVAWTGGPAIQTVGVDISERKEREAQDANYRDELEATVWQRTAEIEEKSRSLEAALKKEREYNSLMEQFVAMASHEFRTPLTIIDAVAQRLFRRADRLSPDDLKRGATKVRGAVQRMILLIESVLSSASMDAGKFKMKPEPCSLKAIVERACRREQELATQHDIATDLDDLPDDIVGDPGMLEQVFSNLLSNAVKYSPRAPEIRVVGETSGRWARIAVIDRGVGIPEEEHSKLFDRFFRASTSGGIAGTGIGLNLAAQIVELHGGQIEVESAVGLGSTFTVHIPVRTVQEHRPVVFDDDEADAVLSPAAAEPA